MARPTPSGLGSDWAWAAGFYDGEGCTTLSRKSHHAHVRMGISQKDRQVLDKFLAIVGAGQVHCGRIYRWDLGDHQEIKRVLAGMWPYLGEMKRAQAGAALEASTWHNGRKDKLKCKDPTHTIAPRITGGRRCLDCQRRYFREYKRRTK